MGTLQKAAVRTALQEFYDTLQKDESDWCLTFEVPPGELWVQVVRDSLNIAWPFDEAAAGTVQRDLGWKLSQSPKILFIDPGVVVTFGIELPSPDVMADVLDWLFAEVYRLPYDYQVKSRVESL